MEIKIAPKPSIQLYWSGLINRNRFFFSISKKQINKIKKTIGKLKLVAIPIPDARDYTSFMQIKKKYLSYRNSPGLPKTYLSRSISLQKKLESRIRAYEPAITSSLEELGLMVSLSKICIYVMPGIGENAESLGNVLVIGDSFQVYVALGTIIEELLHSLLRKHTKSIKLPFKAEKDLCEEILTGFYLFKVLKKLKISTQVINSLVFDWQNGRRRKGVEYLLKIEKN